MIRLAWGALLILFGTLAARAQMATTAAGTVYFEAERFTNRVDRGSQSWRQTNEVAGFSVDGYLHALPNAGSNINVAVPASSPEAQYGIQFTVAGTYGVWVRVYADDGTEDSIHVGLDGGFNAAGSNLNWNTYGAWVWTNGAAKSVTVPSTGLHTLNLWMREDGARVDRFVLATDTTFRAVIGNSFHIPANAESDLASAGYTTMRFPLTAIFTNTPVRIFNGNQFQGGGNPGNQLLTGSAIFYRNVTNAQWTELPMQFYTQGVVNVNNKYFVGTLPTNTFQPGDVIEYYVRVPYSDRLPTYLYGSDVQRKESELEREAQADPYRFTIQWPLQPSGGFHSITNNTPTGQVEARLFTESGHLQIVGPDLAGNPLANVISFAPPQAMVDGETHSIGSVLAVTPLTNGLELTQRLAATTVTTRLTFPREGVARYEVTDWGPLAVTRTAVIAPSDSSERFFGLGEKFNSVDQSGRNVRMLTWDPPGDKGDQSYKVAPWFLSTRGYGFHLDSTAESYFDLRATQSDRVAVSNLFGSLAFNVVYGPKLTDALARYTAYSGRPELSPPWAFGPWMSSDYWRNGGELRYVVTRFRELGIPSGAFVFDSPWAVSYNDYTWNMTQFGSSGTYEGTNWPGFASVGDLMSFFRTNGWKIICWMTPFVNTNSFNEVTTPVPGINLGKASNYDEGATNNFYVRASTNGPPLVAPWWKGRGSPVDFTNPDAARWLQKQLSNLVEQSGGVIGGFKTDDGETSNGTETYIPTSAVYADGRTGIEMRNGYCVEYHRTVWQVLGTNGVLFARSGFSGSQRYPAYWSGDNAPNFGQANGLLSVIVAGQSAGLSGFSIWGHDIGGYQVNNSPVANLTNLFMRWTQFGAFSPIFQLHRQVQQTNQYPWSFGAAARDSYRFYAQLHQSLFPYLYTYAQVAHTSGWPILRHPVLVHQTDTNVFGVNHSYYFGDYLYVAPATAENQTQRGVYLPSGVWYDFWTNRAYAGGQAIVWTNTDPTQIAVFVREGAILPMLPTNVMTLCEPSYVSNAALETWNGALDVWVYPGTNSSLDLYDGSSFGASSHDTVVTLDATTAPRPIAYRIRSDPPAGVERNGIRLPAHTNEVTYRAAPSGWIYDAASGFTLVKFSHTGGFARVRLGPDTVGDGIPNSWRLHHFGTATTTDATTCATCDADGDGVSNYDEYRQGTDPMSAGEFLRISDAASPAILGTNALRIRWPGAPGIPYRVGWKDNLDDALPWQLTTAEYTGNQSVLQWLDDGMETGSAPGDSPSGRRAYRVVVP